MNSVGYNTYVQLKNKTIRYLVPELVQEYIYNKKLYIQVTESLQGEEVRNRELAPLEKIRDNYEKIVLSMDLNNDANYNGIKSLNIIDWLLENN